MKRNLKMIQVLLSLSALAVLMQNCSSDSGGGSDSNGNNSGQSVFGVVVNSATLSVVEGSSGTVGVKLNAQPSANVIVNLSSDNTTAMTVSPSAITFTPANWDTFQTVTFLGVQDGNNTDENPYLLFSSASFATQGIKVAVHDDDVLAIVAQSSSININEGTSTTLGVRLSVQPAGNVVVNVVSQDTNVATVSASNLTFTPANWNIYQNVTVAALQDANLSNDTTNIFLTSAGLPDVAIPVQVADDDKIKLVIGNAPTTILEGQGYNLQVKLEKQPATNIVVLASGTGVSGVTPSLTFTPSNWNTYQTVAISTIVDSDPIVNSAKIQFMGQQIVSADVPFTIGEWVESKVATINAKPGATVTVQARLFQNPGPNGSGITGYSYWVFGSWGGYMSPVGASGPYPVSQWSTYQTITITAPPVTGTYALNIEELVYIYGNGYPYAMGDSITLVVSP